MGKVSSGTPTGDGVHGRRLLYDVAYSGYIYRLYSGSESYYLYISKAFTAPLC